MRNYNMKIDKPFEINMQINKHNLDVMIDELKSLASECEFYNTRINKTLLSLHLMRKHLHALKNNRYATCCTLAGVKHNAHYPDLLERYIHTNCMDPCSAAYKREIRHLLLAGTNIAELDITATVVYLFAKYISEDEAMLNIYEKGDFYSIFKDKSRDEQKKLVQIWLQGYYIPDMKYNKIFPVTGEFLKNSALKKDDLYKRNSGLFRDKEVKLLDAILESNLPIINHLHDGYYLNNRHKSKCGELIKKVWGESVKYKVHDFAKDNYSDEDIKNIIRNIDWKEDTEDIVDFTSIPQFIIQHNKKIINLDPYGSLMGLLLDDRGNCVYDEDGNYKCVEKSYVVRKLCMSL